MHSYILIRSFIKWLSIRNGGSKNPEQWLSPSGIVAQFGPDYSYWLWLRLIEGIGSITERKLLEYFGNPKNIYEADQEQLRLVEGIGPKLARNIQCNRSLDQAFRLQEDIFKQDINMLTIHDTNYPQQLLKYPGSPIVLYYKGKIRDSKSGVAVVGARRCSNYGKKVALDAATYLASHSIPVISGLAKGIDSYAHSVFFTPFL